MLKRKEEGREGERVREEKTASSCSSSTFPGRYESLWRRDSRLPGRILFFLAPPETSILKLECPATAGWIALEENSR